MPFCQGVGLLGGLDGSWWRWDCATNTHHKLPIAGGPFNDMASCIDPVNNIIFQAGGNAPSLPAQVFDMATGAPTKVQYVASAQDELAIRTGQYANLLRIPGEPGNFLYTRNAGSLAQDVWDRAALCTNCM
jgi:hypothetical protein